MRANESKWEQMRANRSKWDPTQIFALFEASSRTNSSRFDGNEPISSNACTTYITFCLSCLTVCSAGNRPYILDMHLLTRLTISPFSALWLYVSAMYTNREMVAAMSGADGRRSSRAWFTATPRYPSLCYATGFCCCCRRDRCGGAAGQHRAKGRHAIESRFSTTKPVLSSLSCCRGPNVRIFWQRRCGTHFCA